MNDNNYLLLTNISEPDVAQVKNFFTSLGSSFKTFVATEQQSISQFLSESPKPTTESKSPAKPSQLLPPWLDIKTDDPQVFEEVKNQIMSLTKSKRNFLSAPPDDLDFPFNFDDHLPLAQVCLKADPMLSQARFYLVPKCIIQITGELVESQ